MAFGVEELRVLRRALALALHPSPASAEDVQDCLRLAGAVDEAAREGARLRAFLLADLARYRAALPGTVSGYLALLEDVLAAGYQPVPDDLAALRALRGNPAAAALLERCRDLAETAVRAKLAGRAVPGGRAAGGTVTRRVTVPASRARLTALPGGLSAVLTAPGVSGPARAYGPVQADRKPSDKPAPKPQEEPAPQRPVPTPAEVFPPRKRPAPPAEPKKPDRTPDRAPDRDTAPEENPPQQLAAG
ncbi:hypothetical protein ACFVT5_26445 [Streptomyces sp. NPDC058001]|uniref:hypothetical protein n=1 Tax=Streptomyces sp. NPDC058001 TaxID=3346300 RepID=UPI0036F016CC